jgi:hypothetical protein
MVRTNRWDDAYSELARMARELDRRIAEGEPGAWLASVVSS